GLTFILGLLLAQIILLFLHRARPYDAGVSNLIIDKTVDWSFPSDHAIASLSIVFSYMASGMRKQAAWAIIPALLVCASRIFVGMHYVSDILGGAAVALVAAWIVKSIYPKNMKFEQWVIRLF
ncbi:MAG: phosphatase PAP2 family protein, partial [Alphaproteobacteria bacterium]|nr:phosphatase PAP2 family protein [Alphaproteobacteria bacterium]